MPAPLHFLHWLVWQWCWQMPVPPHPLHFLLSHWCGQTLRGLFFTATPAASASPCSHRLLVPPPAGFAGSALSSPEPVAGSAPCGSVLIVQLPRPGWAPDPLMVGIRSSDGLVVGLAPATLEFWVRFQTRGTRENRAPPCVQVPGSSRVPVRDGQTSPHRPRLVVSRSTCPPLSPSPHAHSFIIGTAAINTHRAPACVKVPGSSHSGLTPHVNSFVGEYRAQTGIWR